MPSSRPLLSATTLALATSLTFMALSGCRTAVSAASNGSARNEATVVRVTDGDTLRVRIGGRDERIRLIGIDAPEIAHDELPADCFGPEAAAHLTELTPPGTKVRLVRDTEARDVYGRLLAYVYRATDGMFVNVRLATDGMTRPLTIEPNTAHVNDIGAALTGAQAQRRGLWGACEQSASTKRASR